jgi:hypothetical protein
MNRHFPEPVQGHRSGDRICRLVENPRKQLPCRIPVTGVMTVELPEESQCGGIGRIRIYRFLVEVAGLLKIASQLGLQAGPYYSLNKGFFSFHIRIAQMIRAEGL